MPGYLAFFVGGRSWRSHLHAVFDVRLAGRLNATMRTCVWGTLPLGSLVGGFLGSTIGIAPTIAIGAFVSRLASLAILPIRERA